MDVHDKIIQQKSQNPKLQSGNTENSVLVDAFVSARLGHRNRTLAVVDSCGGIGNFVILQSIVLET